MTASPNTGDAKVRVRHRRLWGYLAQRAALAAGSLFVATFGAFVALRIAPGNALTLLAAGRELDPALEAAWRVRYGFDQPVVIQYLIYVRNLIEGDFGLSYYYSGRPVIELLAPALLTTVRWQIPALLMAIVGALALSVATTGREKRWLDSTVTLLLLIGISLPEFVIAIFLVSLFSLRLGLLPVAGDSTPAHFILPALTMAVYSCAVMAQILRGELEEVMQQDYVRTARAKGQSIFRAVRVHALPNAALPFLAVVAIQVGRCIGGAFLIETIYNIPGVGRLAVQAVMQRDYPVVLAVTTLMTVAFVIVNLVVDLLAGVFDPRISIADD